jgi:hypothetical protein
MNEKNSEIPDSIEQWELGYNVGKTHRSEGVLPLNFLTTAIEYSRFYQAGYAMAVWS